MDKKRKNEGGREMRNEASGKNAEDRDGGNGTVGTVRDGTVTISKTVRFKCPPCVVFSIKRQVIHEKPELYLST